MNLDTVNSIKSAAYEELLKRVKTASTDQLLGVSGESPVPAVVMQISDRYPAVDPNLIQLLVDDVWAYGHSTPADDDGKVVAVDFDGTLVDEAPFPSIGPEIPGAVENLKKLITEGWKVIIYSCRANLPGGREQIVAWCTTAGLPVRAVLPKVHARWYIDNRAIAFNNDWEKTYEKLHYDVHTELPSSRVTPGDILAGDVTINDIANHLSLDAEELNSDISSVYGEHSPSEVMILQSMFREKYGLNINLSRLAESKDTSKYWRTHLAGLVDKVNSNRIAEGDTVLIVRDGPRFASKGVVLTAGATGATVAIDGTLNDTVTVSNPTEDLKLLYGKAALSTTNPLLVSANTQYPSGMTASDLEAWYSLAMPRIAKSCEGLRTIRTYAIGNGDTLTNTTVSLDPATTEPKNLVSVDLEIGDASKVAAIRITPTEGYSDASTKLVLADLVDHLVGYPHLSDMHLRYDGDSSYYLLLGFDNVYQTSSLQESLKGLVSEYITNSGMPGHKTYATAEPKSLIIDATVTTYPAAYSINKVTGGVCLPLDLARLETFSKGLATTSSLCRGVVGANGSTVYTEGV